MEDSNIVTQPVSNPQKDPHIAFIGMVLFISLVISTLAVFLFWQNQQLRAQLIAMQKFPSPANIPSASVSPNPIDPTSNWQTFTNNEWGFSIKYPSGWKTSGNPSGVGFGPKEIAEDTLVGVQAYLKTDYTVKKITDEMGSQFPDRQVKQEDITIKGAGLKAKKVTVTTPSAHDWQHVAVIVEGKTHLIAVNNGAIKDGSWPTNRGVPEGFTFEQFYSTLRLTATERSMDPLSIIQNETKPMVWSAVSETTITDKNGARIPARIMTSKVLSKEENKIAPLMVSDSTLTSKYGWNLIPEESADGPGMTMVTYRISSNGIENKLIISQGGQDITVKVTNK